MAGGPGLTGGRLGDGVGTSLKGLVTTMSVVSPAATVKLTLSMTMSPQAVPVMASGVFSLVDTTAPARSSGLTAYSPALTSSEPENIFYYEWPEVGRLPAWKGSFWQKRTVMRLWVASPLARSLPCQRPATVLDS